MHKLHDLKKTLLDNLEMCAEKGINNDTDLKRVDMMAHATKNLGKVIEMCEEEESGSSYRGSTYRMGGRAYDDGESRMPRAGSYQDNAYRRRDSMGRYSREGGSYERGYAEASNDMNDMLEGLMRQARTEEERQTIHEMMEQLKARS